MEQGRACATVSTACLGGGARRLEKPQRELYILEGPIKALAFCAAGLPSIGLAGVDTGHDVDLWRSRKIARLHEELLARVVWRGRTVTIVFDAGRETNPMVAHGESRLALALKNEGATVRVAALKPLPNGKEGPDDYLKAQGIDAILTVLQAAQLADPVARIQSVFRDKTPKEAAREVYGWLGELPFLAALSVGGVELQNQAAWECKPHVSKKLFADKVSHFKALLVGRVLAEEQGVTDVDAQIARMNQEHAVVFLGGSGFVLWEQEDPIHHRPTIEFLNEKSLHLKYKNKPVLITNDNGEKRSVPVSLYWLTHPQRRSYNRVVFEPGGAPDDYYNLWRGWSVHPSRGDWSLLRTHIYENICGKSADVFGYVYAWMADAVQNPARRPGVAIVLRGKEGTGKGKFVKHFGSLFGQHFLQVSNPRHFLGNFNAHLANCLLLFADEAFWAGDKTSDGILKSLITEPTHSLERKGQDVVEVANYVHLIMASNADWVVPAGMEARRYLVLDVAELRMQDAGYFAAIDAQMESGGREAMMHDLQAYDLTDYDLRAVPQTRALWEQKQFSMSAINQFWYGRLRDGEPLLGRDWSAAVPCHELYALYARESQLAGEKRRSREVEFGMQFKKLVPKLTRAKKSLGSRDPTEGYESRRVWCYLLPSLADCRAAFASLVHYDVDWDEEPCIPSEHGASQSILPPHTEDLGF